MVFGTRRAQEATDFLEKLMKNLLAVASALCVLITSAHAAPSSTTISAKGGPIRIMPYLHGSVGIEYGGKVLYADPVSAGDYSKAKKADLIFITHIHEDHLDTAALKTLSKSTTLVVAPQSVIEKMQGMTPKYNGRLKRMDNGQKATVSGISVEAVAMYNLVRGPKPGQKFHPKGLGNGYVLTLGGKRVYIAGDTEATSEMKALRRIDAAFLPMNLPYTMTPAEAAAGAKAFKPKVAFPYHYRFPFDKPNDSPQQFQAALKGTNTQVRILEWYPAAAVAKAMAAMKK